MTVLPPTGQIDGQDMLLRLMSAQHDTIRAEIKGTGDATKAEIHAIRDALAPRLEMHDKRLTAVEISVIEIRSTLDQGRGAMGFGRAIWGIVGGTIMTIVVSAGIWINGQMHQTPPVEHSKTTIEQTLTPQR